MKKAIFGLISLSMLLSCSNSNNEEEILDDSLCLCETYFDEYYSTSLIPSYQIKSLEIEDLNGQLLMTVTYYEDVDMRKVTSIKNGLQEYKVLSNDGISQFNSSGNKGLQFVCKHTNKRSKFNKYLK